MLNTNNLQSFFLDNVLYRQIECTQHHCEGCAFLKGTACNEPELGCYPEVRKDNRAVIFVKATAEE